MARLTFIRFRIVRQIRILSHNHIYGGSDGRWSIGGNFFRVIPLIPA